MVQRVSDHTNILFTSAGRRVELLIAFRRAYASLGLQGNIVALDTDPLAPALRRADRPHIVPRISAPEYIPTLVEICRRERISVIFPLIDPDVPVLAEHRDLLEATGARLAVVPLKAAAIANDKWLTSQFFQSLGITTPKSWLPPDLDLDHIHYPLFIKPRRGSAAKSTYRVSNPRELQFFLDYVPDPVVQEWMPGPEITNDVICDLDGDILAVISRRRIEVRWGEVAKGVTIHDQSITDACVRAAKALPAVGPITVQCMIKENAPYFTEINARLGGGVPLGIAAGVDSPRYLLAKAAGIATDIPPLGAYQTGLYLTRFDSSYFLTEGDLGQVASHRI